MPCVFVSLVNNEKRHRALLGVLVAYALRRGEFVAHELRASGDARRPLGVFGFPGKGKQDSISGGAAGGDSVPAASGPLQICGALPRIPAKTSYTSPSPNLLCGQSFSSAWLRRLAG